jgi:hypothetical protein
MGEHARLHGQAIERTTVAGSHFARSDLLQAADNGLDETVICAAIALGSRRK